MLWAGPDCRCRRNYRVCSGKSRRDAGMTPADHSLCHVNEQPTVLQCSSPLQKLATCPFLAWAPSLSRKEPIDVPKWNSFPLFSVIPGEGNGKLSGHTRAEIPFPPQPCLFCFFLLHLLLHRYMKHNINSQEVPEFVIDALIIVAPATMQAEETNWFCKNHDCRWSVTLSRLQGKQPSLRCISG